MSIRALWVVSHEKGESEKLRTKSLAGTQYVAIPEDCVIPKLLFTELGLVDADKPYVEVRDYCARQHRSLAVELRLDGPGRRTLWPLLTVTQGALILAWLPLVEAPPEPWPPLPSLASVSQGLALLSGLQDFLCGPGGKPEPDVLASRLAALPSVLLQVCPLGRPLDTPLPAGSVPAAVAPSPGGGSKAASLEGRGPSRQGGSKCGPYREGEVHAVRQEQSTRYLGCCEVEGVLPNVTCEDILVHPCVTSLDASILTACSVDENGGSAFSGPYKFPFSPPLELFRLCSYTSQVKLILAIVCLMFCLEMHRSTGQGPELAVFPHDGFQPAGSDHLLPPTGLVSYLKLSLRFPQHFLFVCLKNI
uniref:Adaptor related protein complex 5 subunit mu 1 n=1 Tax=Sinocyclocheilus grahami TaxID=75366 RepID=A0A672NGV1_SINGR